ncbi:MAG: carboxypeptidase-like regulatory domain-containing protein, partial [Xanthomonadales bacterium]|nr:carboxypeptidase-like regulatory domain-containing protein [Xanthomonadales bacterium]
MRGQGGNRQPRTSRRLLAALVCASLAQGLWSSAALAADAQLDVYAFDQAGAIGDLQVQLDDGPLQGQDAFGALTVRVPAGEHQLRVYRGDELLQAVPLTTVEDEIAQIIINLPAVGEPQISYESSAGGSLQQTVETPSGPPGRLTGQVISAEDGQPLAGARVFVSGTPIDVQTDAEGRFDLELPPGDYSLSVLAGSFNAQTVSGIEIASEQQAERQIELTPTGLELPDFVVLEPFIEGSLAAFVEEKRTSSAVTDILGAEQISRAGDSDAAGALKRVTGLTLVD